MRSCGSCSHCCTVLRVVELHKVAGEHCIHQRGSAGCGIYETRPQVCREYSNDFCEFDAPAEDGFEHFFADYAALLAYCRKRFKRWGA